jgi:hypothetical protein
VAGANFFSQISAKFSFKNVRPQLFSFCPFLYIFDFWFYINKPCSPRISAEGTPLESIFATGRAQVVYATEAY